ncbi:MAG: SAM-dependent methyltransferase [Lachnospiraceae bacterium]|nr:SAM-dependent methyltransferase [Lachnospiraceae bacterium]
MSLLSQRCAAVAKLCGSGECLADIGCDHAYVSIALVSGGAFRRAIAADLRPGPLAAAVEHVEERGLSDRIECRLSDGLSAIAAGEADTLICAGMGGALIERILSTEEEKARSFEKLILQPQSEIRSLRSWLYGSGFVIEAEDMIFEDGKYYPMFRARPAEEACTEQELFLRYGRQALEGRHPVLKNFLSHRLGIVEGLIAELREAGEGERAAVRLKEISEERACLLEALAFYGRE